MFSPPTSLPCLGGWEHLYVCICVDVCSICCILVLGLPFSSSVYVCNVICMFRVCCMHILVLLFSHFGMLSAIFLI